MSCIVAVAILRDSDTVLLTKRAPEKDFPGWWEFPGGKVEEGESPEAALARECLEEIGAEIENLEIFEVTFHRYPTTDVLLLFYECELKKESRVRNIEVVDHKWCKISELHRHELPLANKTVVRKLQQRAP